MRQVNDQTTRVAISAESSVLGRIEFRKSGRTGNKQHTHVNILTLPTPSGIRQKLWSLRLIVIMGRPGSKATMEREVLTEIIETSSVGDTAEAFFGGE